MRVYTYMGYIAISQIYTVASMPATSSSRRVGSRNSNCRIEPTSTLRLEGMYSTGQNYSAVRNFYCFLELV